MPSLSCLLIFVRSLATPAHGMRHLLPRYRVRVGLLITSRLPFARSDCADGEASDWLFLRYDRGTPQNDWKALVKVASSGTLSPHLPAWRDDGGGVEDSPREWSKLVYRPTFFLTDQRMMKRHIM